MADREVPRRITTAISVGTLLNPLNSSMIAVALVPMQHEFGVSLAASSWLISGFYLAASVGQPVMGRLADRYGPRRVFVAGVGLVGATGVLVLLSPGFGWVVAGRVLQAFGSSVGFPAGLALIRRLAGGRPPAGALGAIAAANSASAAFGPVLGGGLVGVFGWRAIFAVNIPIAAAGVFLAYRWLPSDASLGSSVAAGTDASLGSSVAAGTDASLGSSVAAGTDASLGSSVAAGTDASSVAAGTDEPREAAGGARALLRELDLPGVALFAAAITTLLGFLLSGTWPLLLVVPVAAALLAWRELRADTPFLDLRELGARPRLVGVLAQQIAVQCVFYLIFFGLPQWLEKSQGRPAATTGLLMLPVAALGVLLTPVATRVVRRFGAWVAMLLGSVGLLGGGLMLLSLHNGTGIWYLIAVATVLGLPLAFNNLGLQAGLYSAASAGQTGTAAGLFQTGRYVGAILSTALLGAVYAGTPSSAGLHRAALFVVVSAVLLAVASPSTPSTGRVTSRAEI